MLLLLRCGKWGRCSRSETIGGVELGGGGWGRWMDGSGLTLDGEFAKPNLLLFQRSRDLGSARLGEIGHLRGGVFFLFYCCLTFWPRDWHNTRARYSYREGLIFLISSLLNPRFICS